MINYPRRAFKKLIDAVFPFRCMACGKYLDGQYICGPCLRKLPIKKQNACIGCQRPTPMGKTCTFCRDDYALDRLFVVTDFNNSAVAALIRAFKYKFISDLAVPLAQLAAKHFDHLAKRDGFSIIRDNLLFIPVPLFKTREYSRGFNQAELLARLIARRYRLDVSTALVRIINTVPQAQLKDRPERLSNVQGLYACTDPKAIKGRNVVIVDDVCTTGATLNECARVLKEAGAVHVSGLAIARG